MMRFIDTVAGLYGLIAALWVGVTRAVAVL